MDLGAIKAVTFDAGGTLIEPFPSVGELYAAVAKQLGHTNISATALSLEFADAWKRKHSFDYSLMAWHNLVKDVFGESVPATRLPELFEAIYQRFAEGDAWKIYDDVFETLSTLQERGYRLGIISNWDDRLRGLLSKLQLSQYFEFVVLSVDVGANKPARQIFERALSALQLAPGAVLHLGDSAEEDVAGATQCGLSARLLDRSRSNAQALPELTLILSELPGVES